MSAPAPAPAPDDHAVDDLRFRRVVESLVGQPVLGGNTLDVLRNGDEIFPAMLAAVRGAQRRIDMVTYVYWTGAIAREFAAALAERARAGVAVRLLLDAVGSIPMPPSLVTELREAGVEVRFFRPPVQWKFWSVDNRTHRKVLVVDGRTAFTGGVGIASEWEGDARNPDEWRDTHVRVTGPAVDGLHACFIADWQQTVQVLEPPARLPEAPEPTGDVEIAVVDDTPRHGRGPSGILLRGLLEHARRRVRLATPYYNPPDDIGQLLCELAGDGMSVDVLVPGPHVDKRVSDVVANEQLRPLHRAGARVWKYQPTMLHTKVLLVDDAVAVVGSHNCNRRSLGRDAEVALVVFDAPTVRTLDRDFQNDLGHARRWTPPSRWSPAGVRDYLGHRLLRPIRAQM